jgi:hypothetical protein
MQLLTISTLCNKNTVCEDRKKPKKKHPYTAKSGVSEVYFFSGSVFTKLPSPPVVSCLLGDGN